MLYVTYSDLESEGYVGIKKKVLAQVLAFKKEFKQVYYTCWAFQIAYLMDGDIIIEREPAVTRKDYNIILCHWIEKYQFKQIYIRYPYANKWFIGFCHFLKEQKIKIVLEIPTYPYDNEIIYGRLKVEDAYFREQLNQYVDLITTYSNHKKIWGVPCIKLKNGVNIEDIPVSTRKHEKQKIVFIAVSSMAPWHGYERLLEGIYRYYQKGGKYELHLKFIGTGPEENSYKRITQKYGLQSCVEFCGKMIGKTLDRQYDTADIAIGSLGMYKIGISEGSPIKVAEYCMRGIPFVYAYRDLRFPQQQDFLMTVTNDSQPIDLDKVILFFEKISAVKQYKEYMRDYAINNLSWESIMKPVIEFLNNKLKIPQ